MKAFLFIESQLFFCCFLHSDIHLVFASPVPHGELIRFLTQCDPIAGRSLAIRKLACNFRDRFGRVAQRVPGVRGACAQGSWPWPIPFLRQLRSVPPPLYEWV
jgi:hypothetical protein